MKGEYDQSNFVNSGMMKTHSIQIKVTTNTREVPQSQQKSKRPEMIPLPHEIDLPLPDYEQTNYVRQQEPQTEKSLKQKVKIGPMRKSYHIKSHEAMTMQRIM